MKYYTLTIVALMASMLYIMTSCLDKLPVPSTDCSSMSIAYVEHIKPILDANCNVSGCHDDNAQASFGSYSSIPAGRQTNIFARVCVSQDMPPTGSGYSLSAAQVDTIRCWSEGGYLETIGTTTGCSTANITYDDHVGGILDASCNYSGCHDGNFQSPLTWATMDATRRNLVATRVANQSMPPAGNLSQEYMDTIACWKDNGFPEN